MWLQTREIRTLALHGKHTECGSVLRIWFPSKLPMALQNQNYTMLERQVHGGVVHVAVAKVHPSIAVVMFLCAVPQPDTHCCDHASNCNTSRLNLWLVGMARNIAPFASQHLFQSHPQCSFEKQERNSRLHITLAWTRELTYRYGST